MNKRQKKKVVKRALDHLGTKKFTKKDKQILYTIGREAFKNKYGGIEPEMLDKMPEIIETLKKTWNGILQAVGEVFLNLGDAFRNIGKTMQGSEGFGQNNNTVTVNDIEPVHTSEQREQVCRGEIQEERHMDMPRLHLPSYTRWL